MYAAIQSVSIKGDISQNLKRHVHLARAAATHGAELALFPELSLTGYEFSIARDVALRRDDARLDELRDQAQELGITIVAGAPYLADNGDLHIAAFSFLPDGRLSIYSKQHLHAGEAEFFASGSDAGMLEIRGVKTALAICADITQSAHPVQAVQNGAQLYTASVLISPKGYEADTALLTGYARAYGMPVLMANYAGTTGGWKSEGRSAMWNEFGELVVAAPGDEECIVLAGRENGNWRGKVVSV